MLAYRVDNSWYIRAVATNRPPSDSAPDPERQYLQEFVPRQGTSALTMCLESRKTGNLESSTTVTEAWRGTGYSIEPLEFDEVEMPLYMAYSENIISVDMASDAITPSNVAILALPMAMSIVPVAFVADLNTIGMFAYILVTDVFSMIPFLVKGIELIRSSSPTKTTIMFYHGGNETIGKAQIYIVNCRGEGYFKNTGVIFVAVAIGCALSGLALEIWALCIMKKRREKKQKGEVVLGPFGYAGFDKTTMGLLGREETHIEHDFWDKWNRSEEKRKKRNNPNNSLSFSKPSF